MGQPAIYLSDAKEGGLERGLADGAEEAPPLLCWRVPSILPIAKWMLICAGMIFGIGVVWDSGFDIPGCKFFGAGAGRDGGLVNAWEMCKDSVLLREAHLDFHDASRFALVQVIKDDGGQRGARSKRIRTIGEVHVRPADPDDGSDIRVEVAIHGSHLNIPTVVESQHFGNGSTVTLETPRWVKDAEMIATESYCINISATVWIPSNIALSTLHISTESLSVIFHPGLDYAAGKPTDISSNSNTSPTEPEPSLYSRETVIHVHSDSVTGTYPLYDLLSVTTKSGSISIAITPKPASPTSPKPAVLYLDSTSGSIDATTHTLDVPDRDYRSSITGRSSSIATTLLHGRSTTIDSTSGDVTAHLYPYGHNDSRTDISTTVRSASADIIIHPSLTHPTSPLRKLYAFHWQRSGSLDLYYPAQWQGTVEGQTRSGGIDVQWEGLRVVRRAGGWFKGVRGEGEGVLQFESRSGGVRLRGGAGKFV